MNCEYLGFFYIELIHPLCRQLFLPVNGCPHGLQSNEGVNLWVRLGAKHVAQGLEKVVHIIRFKRVASDTFPVTLPEALPCVLSFDLASDIPHPFVIGENSIGIGCFHCLQEFFSEIKSLVLGQSEFFVASISGIWLITFVHCFPVVGEV